MKAVEPFRALRYDDERVSIERVIATRASGDHVDPRNARELVEPEVQGDDDDLRRRGARLRLFLAAWQRAGVLQRDDEPALYYLRGERLIAGAEMMGTSESHETIVSGFFALASPEAGTPFVLHSPEPARVEWERARRTSFDVEADLVVVAHDDDGAEVARLFRGELDREGDVRFSHGGVEWELWVVDDETTIARVQSRIAERRLVVLSGTERWHAAVGRGDDPRVLAFIGSYNELSQVVAPVHLVGRGLDPDELLAELERSFDVERPLPEGVDEGAVLYLRDGEQTEAIGVTPKDADAEKQGPLALALLEVATRALPELEHSPGAPTGDDWNIWLRFPAPDLAALVAHREEGKAMPRGVFRLSPDIPRGLVIAGAAELNPTAAE